MHTHSSPPQSHHGDSNKVSGGTTAEADPIVNVHWTLDNKTALLHFLIDHKAEAGDGLNFKASVWNAAAAHLNPLTTKSGPKNDEKYKSKWTRVSANICFATALLVILSFGSLNLCIKLSIASSIYLVIHVTITHS